jgi:hypothetical protein
MKKKPITTLKCATYTYNKEGKKRLSIKSTKGMSAI